MKYRTAPLTILLGVLLPFILATSTPASQDAPRSKGMACFFVGHSFFCPVALSFDRIAKKSDFPDHDMKLVFRGGQAGTAGALWSSTKARKQIEAVLATGEVELFGLTPGPSDNEKTFKLWFDLALEHNPDTRFFIGTPWARNGAGMETPALDGLVTLYANKCAEVVEKLRDMYPENRIDFLGYGKMAPIMKKRFEAEELPHITTMVGKGDVALFMDERPGHAGPMLLDLCAATWLNELYGANIDSLELPRHEVDVAVMVDEVMAFNAPFRAKDDELDEEKMKDSENAPKK